MAGHSHAHNIKFRKDRVDGQRSKNFSKAARLITIAAREGGGDVDGNASLRLAVDYAKSLSMPKDTIERAIKKGTGELGGGALETCIYEVIGPGGAFIIAEIMTDNRNRTASEIRKLLDMKNAQLGSVAWAFEKKGIVTVPAEGIEEDDLMEIALEAGAEDIENSDGSFMITTAPGDLDGVRSALEEKKITVTSAEFAQVPKNTLPVDEDTGRKLMDLVEQLDDHDDVQNVFYNFDLPESVAGGKS